jgi:hypothetical protein
LVGEEDGMGVQVKVKVEDGVRVWVVDGVRVKAGGGVGESIEGVRSSKVGESLGVRVCSGTTVVVTFPSARESEKLPRTKPRDASAIMEPINTCRKFFIPGSQQAIPLEPVSGH